MGIWGDLIHPMAGYLQAFLAQGQQHAIPSPRLPQRRLLLLLPALSNQCHAPCPLPAPSPPLTQFFLECGGLVRTDKKPALCKSYQKLVSEVWHRRR